MKIQACLYLIVAMTFSQHVFADEKNVIGLQTYKAVCAVCHASGVANAPKVGDKNVWKPLIEEGQVILTAHGYVGVRAMPAKGGNPNLSIEGFADALVYIVNNSGGNWKSPNPQTIAAINKEVESRKAGLNKKQ